MDKMNVLDLFCGGGGAAMGLHYALEKADINHTITGVDIVAQKHYPFHFIQADALVFPLEGYDFYWASPPCQFVSRATQQWRKKGKEYPALIAPMRQRLKTTARPYIIENVAGEPHLINPVKLNGAFFGKNLRRTRFFECSFPVELLLLPKEHPSGIRMGRPVLEGDIITPVGHFSNIPYARRVMGIDWMTGQELAQAIPPAYSEYLMTCYLETIQNERP